MGCFGRRSCAHSHSTKGGTDAQPRSLAAEFLLLELEGAALLLVLLLLLLMLPLPSQPSLATAASGVARSLAGLLASTAVRRRAAFSCVNQSLRWVTRRSRTA